MSNQLKGFAYLRKHWYATEALPIVAVIGVAVGGCAWYLTRLARGPDVVWDRKGNPEPWQNVDPNSNTKLSAVNHKFDKEYKRKEW